MEEWCSGGECIVLCHHFSSLFFILTLSPPLLSNLHLSPLLTSCHLTSHHLFSSPTFSRLQPLSPLLSSSHPSSTLLTSSYLIIQVRLFAIMCPVGPYFKDGFNPIKLYADTDNVRAWPGGTGNAKVSIIPYSV